jgi:nucleotide-binding universal stress UspA family protein
MFRKIVVGYDGPERSAETSALAEALRDPDKGTLLLASAFWARPLLVGGLTLAEDLGVIRETTEALLAEARDALCNPDRVQIRAIPADSPSRMLAEVAEAEHADLVVVGASRCRELGRPLPGTTAEPVIHDAPCAVAVAPPAYPGGDIRRIGVAYDGSPEADARGARRSRSRASSARL